MINNQNTSYKWSLHKFTIIFLVFLASSVLLSCQSSKVSAKKQPIVSRSTQISNSAAADPSPRGLECEPTIANSVVSLDKNNIVPVFQPRGNSQIDIRSDTPTAAYRLNGKTCIHITNRTGYRMCGSSLSNLDPSSVEAIYHSPEKLSFQEFNYSNWLFSPYVLNDGSLVALAHSEWYDCLKYSADSPGYCRKNKNQLNSWANAITLYQSRDSGASWNRIGIVERPDSYPETFKNIWSQGKMTGFGFFHPSNIIRDGNRYYAFVLYTERDSAGRVAKTGRILLSTTNPRSPNWEQVTPQGKFIRQPYTGSILPGTEGWGLVNVTWNTAMCRYLILFWDGPKERLMSTTTASLAKPVFTTPVEVQNQDDIRIPDNPEIGLHDYNYPVAQLDPDSLSDNFETTDDSFFIFMNSFNSKNVLNRSLFRVTARLVNEKN